MADEELAEKVDPEAPRIKKLLLFGKIDNQSIGSLIDQIMNTHDETDQYVLYLNSSGGDPNLAVAFFNFVNYNEINLRVVVIGEASSAAVVVLCAGVDRICSADSIFLLHLVRVAFKQQVFMSTKDLTEHANELDLHEQRSREIQAKVAGKSLEEMAPYYQAEKYIGAELALELGLITEIWDS